MQHNFKHLVLYLFQVMFTLTLQILILTCSQTVSKVFTGIVLKHSEQTLKKILIHQLSPLSFNPRTWWGTKKCKMLKSHKINLSTDMFEVCYPLRSTTTTHGPNLASSPFLYGCGFDIFMWLRRGKSKNISRQVKTIQIPHFYSSW